MKKLKRTFLKRGEIIKQTMSGELLLIEKDFCFEDFLAESKAQKHFWVSFAIELGLVQTVRPKYIQAGDFLTEAEEL